MSSHVTVKACAQRPSEAKAHRLPTRPGFAKIITQRTRCRKEAGDGFRSAGHEGPFLLSLSHLVYAASDLFFLQDLKRQK